MPRRSRWFVQMSQGGIPMVPSVWGITVAKDEADIIGPMLQHHMSLGLSGMILFDNLSCDGTGEIAKSVPGVVVVKDNDGFHNQSRKNCEMTKMAMDRGADWILAIDADEFWYLATFDTIPEMLAATSFDTFRVPGHNQICTVFDDQSEVNPVLRMRWRCRDGIKQSKIAYRCKPGRFAMHGNEATNDVARSPIQQELLLRHYPVRSVEQFRSKVLTAPIRPSIHLKKWYAQLCKNPDGFARFFWKKCVINTAKMRRHPHRWVDDPLPLQSPKLSREQRKWARRAKAKEQRAARRSRIHATRRASVKELRRKERQ